MVEQEGMPFDTLEVILNKFPPQEEIIAGKTYRVSRDPNRVLQDPRGRILYAVPEAVWFERGEEQKNQAMA